MTGSIHDAEDLVQETYLRAWRAYAAFEGRSSVRTWLYRIATNVCLTALEGKDRRPLPDRVWARRRATRRTSSWSPPRCPGSSRRPTRWWRVTRATRRPSSPQRESIRLAFVAALQHLPARQRAVLILRDVLRWKASEVAEALETSEAAVNSALQRAHAQLAKADVTPGPGRRPTSTPQQQEMLDRYVKAFWDKDINAIVGMLTRDAVWEMPPFTGWYAGAENIGRLIDTPVPRRRPRHADGGDQRQRAARLRPLHAPARRLVHAVPPAGPHPATVGQGEPRRRLLRPDAVRDVRPAGHASRRTTPVPRERSTMPTATGPEPAARAPSSCSSGRSPTPAASLVQVTEADLDRPTPCRGWTLLDLLRPHGRLAGGHGGGGAGHLAQPRADRGTDAEGSRPARQHLPPGPGPAGATGTRERGRRRRGSGELSLPRELLGAVGALEITLHGWDVAEAIGQPTGRSRRGWPWTCGRWRATTSPTPTGRSAFAPPRRGVRLGDPGSAAARPRRAVAAAGEPHATRSRRSDR